MKKKLSVILAGLWIGLGSVVAAQAPQTKTYTTIDGEVIRYEPGRLIVVRGSDNREQTYVLTSLVTVPGDVRVGRRVTLYTEPGSGGSVVVSRVTTTSVTPEGNVKRTTEETRTEGGVTTKTTTTEITGKVEAYESGKTLTLQRADGTRVTYVLTSESKLPVDLGVGREVRIVPVIEGGREVARVVTYTVVRPQ